MGIVKKENDYAENFDNNFISDSEVVLGFETALKTMNDMDQAINAYEIVLNTESADVTLHYMQMVYGDDCVLTSESALKGKDGLVAKLKNTVNNIAATMDEHMGWFEKISVNMGSKLIDLEQLRDDLKAGKYVVKDKIGFFSKGDVNIVESHFSLLKAMGLDVNNVSNIAKLMTMPRVITDNIFKENVQIVDLLQKNSTRNAEEFKKIIEEHKLPKANNSINFLKSLKGIELKDVEILCGMVTKVFGKQTSLITMYAEDGKIKIDSDTLTFKHVDLKPQTNINDLIKLVETSIIEFKAAKGHMDKINNTLKGIYKGLPNWLYEERSIFNGITVMMSPTIRYRQNLVRAGINLQYDFWNIQWLTNSYVRNMTKKA